MSEQPSKSAIKELIATILRRLGYTLARTENTIPVEMLYNQDGLVSWHNSDFMNDPVFRQAYDRGLMAAEGIDPNHHWRVHIAIWAAGLALMTKGDFVECGVNAGFISSAIMNAYDWNAQERIFFLVDSFAGPPLDMFNEEETRNGLKNTIEDAVKRGAYVTDLDRVNANFSEWANAKIVTGYVPDVLAEIGTRSVAFLHLDLNAANSEVAALKYFWPALQKGAVILLDDYAYAGFEALKTAIDEQAEQFGFSVLSLPTGQGLIVKGSVSPMHLAISSGKSLNTDSEDAGAS